MNKVHSRNRRLILIFVLFLSILLIAVSINFKNLYMPFWDDEALINLSILKHKEISLRNGILPRWVLRKVLDTKNINFREELYDGGTNDSKSTYLGIIMTAYFFSLNNGGNHDDLKYALSLADRAIKGGAKIDHLDARDGTTILQNSIVFKDVRSINFYLDHGASCNIKIDRPGKPSDGMDAIQLAEFLNKKNNGSMGEIVAILNKKCRSIKAA